MMELLQEESLEPSVTALFQGLLLFERHQAEPVTPADLIAVRVQTPGAVTLAP